MATYHGIKKAICLNCGKLTTDNSALEIMNDIDPTCPACGVHSVAWHTANGITITAQASQDAEPTRYEIKGE